MRFSAVAIIALSFPYVVNGSNDHGTEGGSILKATKLIRRNRKMKATKKGKNSKSTCGNKSNAVRNIATVSEYSDQFSIVQCSQTEVIAEGIATLALDVGDIIVSTGGKDDVICTDCAPLFRKILSISDDPVSGQTTYTTAFATFSDIYEKGLIPEKAEDIEIEPVFGCFYSGNSRVLFPGSESIGARFLQVDDCSDWRSVDANGDCDYTNCHVGTTGDPVNCFECKEECDNGCGAKSGPSFDGNLLLFDFGEACCIHDFCYSAYSLYTQKECDDAFYRNMRKACPTGLRFLLSPKSRIACELVALLFYGLVKLFGEAAAAAAVEAQKKHEKTEECTKSEAPSRQPTMQLSLLPSRDPSMSPTSEAPSSTTGVYLSNSPSSIAPSSFSVDPSIAIVDSLRDDAE